MGALIRFADFCVRLAVTIAFFGMVATMAILAHATR